MADSAPEEITQLLMAWKEGDSGAFEQLMPIVYDELRRLARSYMNRQRSGHTLQATALVNEAYMRLVDSDRVQWQNRAHFFAISAQVMRRILVDAARARNNLKRGGGAQQVTLDETVLSITGQKSVDLLLLDDALDRLSLLSERQSKVVELRYFGGLSEEETAEVLDLSVRTVRRDWSLARAWLYREMTQGEEPAEGDTSND